MRLAERLAVGIAVAAAVTLFVVARYLPESHGHLDRDFPRMDPVQSAWLIGVPFAIVIALVVTRRRVARDRARFWMTIAVATAAVAAVAAYLWTFYRSV